MRRSASGDHSRAVPSSSAISRSSRATSAADAGRSLRYGREQPGQKLVEARGRVEEHLGQAWSRRGYEAREDGDGGRADMRRPSP